MNGKKYHIFLCENCPKEWRNENVDISPCVLLVLNFYNIKNPRNCPYPHNANWKRINIFDKRTKDEIKKGKTYHKLYDLLYKNIVEG